MGEGLEKSPFQISIMQTLEAIHSDCLLQNWLQCPFKSKKRMSSTTTLNVPIPIFRPPLVLAGHYPFKYSIVVLKFIV
jgi:hypothetical protein